MFRHFLLLLLLFLGMFHDVVHGRSNSQISLSSPVGGLKDSTLEKLQSGKPLNRQERKEVELYEHEKYIELRRQGWDEVSNTQEAAALRSYRLRKRKRIGLFFHKKREASLSHIFFPKSRPFDYQPKQPVLVVDNLMRSRKNLAMYDLSNHPAFRSLKQKEEEKEEEKNVIVSYKKTANTTIAYKKPNTITIPLGAKLEGYSKAYKPIKLLNIRVQEDKKCTSIATTTTPISGEQKQFLKFLIQNRYRMHLSLDGLPVLMRSKELNYAVKGVPIGFEAPQQFIISTGKLRKQGGDIFLYNHWRFTVTYNQDEESFDGIRITGFDVHPVSISHLHVEGPVPGSTLILTCKDNSPQNNPNTYLSLENVPDAITFSYEVEWVRSDLPWEDRWDVYFLGLPDDAIHYFSMLNSVVCMLILAAVVALALARVFRKDLVGGAKKENGWKHLKHDVFRPPESPMLLSVLVGNGLHILVSAIITMMLNVCHVINTMKTGEALTGLLFVYCATGSLAGYTSARLYKLCGGENFERNAILTSTALSGSMMVIFCLFNMVAFAIGSSSTDTLSVVELIFLWCCVSALLTYLGSLLGQMAPCIQVPTETSDIVRPIPDSRWTKNKKFSSFACGMICFGVLYVELHFLMSAIWLQMTYLGLGYMLTITLLATIVCAECAICVCYLQLNSEDHDWWWTAFRNGASVGAYMTIYTFSYRFNHIDLAGMYSNVAYFTCMFLATICIGIVCGSIGFLSCLWFTRTIFSAIDLDDDGDEDEEVIPLTNKDVSESLEDNDLQ